MKTKLVVRMRGMQTSSDSVCNVQHMGDSFSLVLWVPPIPASRPRVTRWGVYYTKTYTAYRDAAHEAIPVCEEPTLDFGLGATVEFICKRPKKITRITPRGDVDNYMKAIFDAVVGHAATKNKPCGLKHYITDDDIITHVTASKRYAEPDEEPHTIITIGRI